jgi:hypothetical protein
VVNKKRFNVEFQQRRGRRLWNLLKRKFKEPKEEELTIDQLANYPTKQKFTVFSQVDEDARYERHMKPVREAQNAE